jgi:hypothetical protein
VAEHRQTGENLDDGRGARPTSARPERARVELGADGSSAADTDAERERQARRVRFLAELDEARALRKRVAPRRTRAAELHARVLRTFRY